MHDLLTDETYRWQIGGNYVRLHAGGARHARPMSDVLEPTSASPSRGDRLAAGRSWFESDPLWFKRAVFYEIHIRGFFDGNDDGTGDFRGLTEKLDYLQWLGIDCIWLLPMYPSPLRDGGYDIADFYAIHPDYGTRRGLPHCSSTRRTSAGSA